MSNPIRRGVKRVVRFLLRKVVLKLIARPIRHRLAQFEAATHDPRLVQEALLRGILAHQSATAFGRDHRFDAIRSIEDYRRQVPVAGYEYFEPYVARLRRGETTALLSDPLIHMFALTSGTTAIRKFIPVNQQYLDDYRRGWNIWGLKVFRDHPAVKMQPILQMSGDPDEFRTESGVPCGAVTGLTAQMQKRVIRWLYSVPPCAARIKDSRSKYYVVLLLSIPHRVGMIIAANPSTLINLARAGDQEKETLIRDLHDGTLSRHLDLPDDIRAELTRRLRRHPERSRQLEEIVNKTGTLYPKDYWPSDCILGNWMGGSVGSYLRHYPRYFGSTPVRDIGLIASEGRMTIPLADGTPAGVLDVTTHYFEFIPEAEGDSPNPAVLGAHELKEGATYFILLTTAFGLYRYHIHDLVRVAGFHNGTPLIEFLSKGANIANITGEKLSEHHVTQAMAELLRELDVTLTAYSLAPCWPNAEPAGGSAAEFEQPYYGLFVEQGDFPNAAVGQRLAENLDSHLRKINVEYDSKRASQRLGPVRLEVVPSGFWLQWDRQRLLKTGGALEQYKHPCLINDLQFRKLIIGQLLPACRVPTHPIGGQ
ncbi:MAG TPA: GH3 auxin-responsive promoter family protein [Gemmataceae bacterium]|nr:GH3 auxin-responsive promoter family protein [Gemmataceae bacterium]